MLHHLKFLTVFSTAILLQFALFVSASSAADDLICDDYLEIIDLGPMYSNPDLQAFAISGYEFAKSGKFEEAIERSQLTMDLYDSGCGQDSREMYNPQNLESPHSNELKFQTFAACSMGDYEGMVALSRKKWGNQKTSEIAFFITSLYEIKILSDEKAVDVSLSPELLDKFIAETDLSMLKPELVCEEYNYPHY